jgi:hypothetical protein
MKDETSRRLLLVAADGVSLENFEKTLSAGSKDARDGDEESTIFPGSIAQFPPEAVAEYIAEMCEAMAYMARAHNCDDLSNLLLEAADEAGRCKSVGLGLDLPR